MVNPHGRYFKYTYAFIPYRYFNRPGNNELSLFHLIFHINETVCTKTVRYPEMNTETFLSLCFLWYLIQCLLYNLRSGNIC